ncbi:cytoplasmic dynein 2 intermediate chain 1 isoform X1 [Athalia rosae]|uniref:cytoplasmic dynein 2 intermediate chain 1 isoform X1 n=1 Tax=Athalia rosae TaxID=37344 RepID=UPI0020348712|nr:cytoplasmic dynein 2 intermediate chain 1 isoform X1 [Athalia rosae]
MSQKGAIKKTSESTNTSKTRVLPKTKSKYSNNDGSLEVSSSTESKDLKLVQHRDRMAAGDRLQKTLQNSLDKSTSKQISSKDKLATSQTTRVKQNRVLTSSRSGAESSPRYMTQSMKNTTILKSKPEKRKVEDKKLGTVAKQNSMTAKSGVRYSEKRGTSSIYLPESTRSSNIVTSKTSGQVIKSKSNSLSTRDREKPAQTHNKSQSAKDVPRRSSRERKKSRTLSPSEVKILHSVMKTANMINNSKNGKDNSTANDAAHDYDYEDDFEECDSDSHEFTDSEVSQVSEEQKSSDSPEPEPIEMQREKPVNTIGSADGRKSEEENMLDSGHYELTEARRRAAYIESMSMSQPKPPPVPELRQSNDKMHRQEKISENKSLPLSSTDEGFEDGRSGDFAKSPPDSQMTFIDFQKPKKADAKEKLGRKLKRGQELLSMIRLDTIEWSLIEYTPVAYDDFIRTYGRLNTQQIAVQTNEDDLEVETQTDAIEVDNKWTQFPVTCRRNLKTIKDVKLFRMEQIGVGEDRDPDLTNSVNLPSYDILQLNEFLRNAGRVMLSLLEERRVGGNVLQCNSHELPFSEGFIKLAVDSVSFLADRRISHIHYSDTLNKMLITIHVQNNEGVQTSSREDYLTDCCIGCVWSISEPSTPIKLFYSFCPITACCFHSTNYNVIFAGLEDGSINLWDLREEEMWHHKVTDKVNEVDWILRSATYTTADTVNENYHNSEIVAIRVISHIDKDISSAIKDRLAPIQICTLDEHGELIIWSVLYTMGVHIEDLGLAHWGDIRLQKSDRIILDKQSDDMEKCFRSFIDLHVDSIDTNNLFLATNSNKILHATCIGNKVAPKFYRGNEMEFSGGTRCIEGCPFKLSYFLVGCDDGTVRLHSLMVEKALLHLHSSECTSLVKSIQWSKSKPFTFFVLDNASKIHIWNLCDSDMYPMYTISMTDWGYITSMQLSPCRSDHDMVNQYLALGTDAGRVEIHKLKKEFCFSQRKESEQELETFLRYVDIL